MQNLLSSSLLSGNINIKIYRTTISPVVLYGCEAWSLTLRDEYRLRFLANRMLRNIFGSKKDEVTGEWGRLSDLYSSPNIIWVIKSRRMRWAGHVARMVREEVHKGFWWENLRERARLEYSGVDGSIILKWIFKKGDGGQTGLIWHRTGKADGLL